jgi:hypothetical protein
VKDKGWVQAKDLQRGEILISAKGAILSLSDITIEERDEVVYNFEVEGNHTYYVGDAGVLVHNTCKIEGSPEEKKALFDDLQRLTDDKLKIDNDGNITIETKIKNPKRVKGTQLVKDAIETPKKITISYMGFWDKMKFGLNGYGFDGDNAFSSPINRAHASKPTLGSGSHITIGRKVTADDVVSSSSLHRKEIPKIFKTEIPEFITLGHELIHSVRAALGLRNSKPALIGIPGHTMMSNFEEGFTTGVPTYGKVNIGRPQYPIWEYPDIPSIPTYPVSQNDLLLENGFQYIRPNHMNYTEIDKNKK